MPGTRAEPIPKRLRSPHRSRCSSSPLVTLATPPGLRLLPSYAGSATCAASSSAITSRDQALRHCARSGVAALAVAVMLTASIERRTEGVAPQVLLPSCSFVGRSARPWLATLETWHRAAFGSAAVPAWRARFGGASEHGRCVLVACAASTSALAVASTASSRSSGGTVAAYYRPRRALARPSTRVARIFPHT